MGKRKDKSSNSTALGRTSMVTRGTYNKRLRYRSLLEGFSTLEDEGATLEEKLEYTSNAIRTADELLAEGSMEETVKNPGEAYLASRVLRAAGDMTARCAESVSGNVNTYDRKELALHIKMNSSMWNVQFPREVPVVSYLFGTFDGAPPEQRERAPRARVERRALAERKAPANVDKLEKTEEGAEMVGRVKRFIKTAHQQGGPVSYFHCVLDPDSFSRSVENVYHLSFLARMGYVSVQVDEEHGLPFVTPVPESAADPGDDENQFIVSLDMKRWEELVRAFGIKKPMMVLKR